MIKKIVTVLRSVYRAYLDLSRRFNDMQRSYERAWSKVNSLTARVEELWNENRTLKERMGEDFQDQNFISCQKNGNPRGLCSLNTEIRRLCERNGLPHITVHGLRHMYATILAERGVPLTKISALLGHHSVHTTFEFYLEVIEGGNQITDFLNKEFLAEEAAYGSK